VFFASWNFLFQEMCTLKLFSNCPDAAINALGVTEIGGKAISRHAVVNEHTAA
jgi:hypothetical protein